MNPDEEQQLRASFSDLRREDQRLAPPFERDWQAAVRLSLGTRPPRFPLARVAAAVAAVAAVGVAAALLNRPSARDDLVAGRPALPVATPRAPEPRESELAASIEDWESPTAALLELSPEDGSRPGENF
jgi:hypothetical protein